MSHVLGRLAGAAACALILSAAEPAAEDWRLERQEWTWDVELGAPIRIDNPWGDLLVRTHDKSEIYLLANWQHHRDDPRRLELAAETSPDGASARLDFANAEMDVIPPAWAKRRADITVFVPATATTRFSTDRGTLEVRGTLVPTTVETVSGEIRLRIAGGATARTEHGNVLAQLLRIDGSRAVEVTTVTGSIRLEMPRDGRATVTLETRGEITSDYSMDLERVPGSQLKRVRITAGAAGEGVGRIQLLSYSGPIKIIETLIAQEKD